MLSAHAAIYFSNSTVTVISVYLRWLSVIISVEAKVSWVIKEQLPHLSVAHSSCSKYVMRDYFNHKCSFEVELCAVSLQWGKRGCDQ